MPLPPITLTRSAREATAASGAIAQYNIATIPNHFILAGISCSSL